MKELDIVVLDESEFQHPAKSNLTSPSDMLLLKKQLVPARKNSAVLRCLEFLKSQNYEKKSTKNERKRSNLQLYNQLSTERYKRFFGFSEKFRNLNIP